MRERPSGPLQNVRGFFFFTYFVSCNGPCAPKKKWRRKEHIIIIINYYCPADQHLPYCCPKRRDVYFC